MVPFVADARENSLNPSVFRSKKLTSWLGRTGETQFSLFCIVAAFATYACMYGFRKSYTVGIFQQTEVLNIGYKAALVASQIIGYTLSKFIGIKFVSEIPAKNRAFAILALIAFAQFALLLFAIVPAPYNIACLFLNGLPLGIVFGLVLTFLEGRTVSEALVAGLCASFIFASGFAKTVGKTMLENGVSEMWMPFESGLVFVLPLLFSVWLINHIPPPKANDESRRTKRQSMDRTARWAFVGKHWFGLVILAAVFIVLTVIRSIRDDFAVEIWKDMGYQAAPEDFTQTELWVMVVVTAVAGATFLIGSHRLAFLTTIGLIVVGLLMVIGSVISRQNQMLSPFNFMVFFGIGVYIPYVLFHTTVFERLIAAYQEKATVGFLMYLVDSLGYLFYLLILLSKTITLPTGVQDERQSLLASWVGDYGFLVLLESISFYSAIACVALCCLLGAYFSWTLPKNRGENPADLKVQPVEAGASECG